ncbi:MAG: hypothetical protein CBC09_09010 [Cellvibrionales bacterium TMED49]|nr:MAG: hypothetical protein CBC09_09010 [Cellvibrionales bacterium TMED49]|tara:strand:+ start:122 stop:469 length:348 start_codon:yes stop_codon:yes gene_type:complete
MKIKTVFLILISTIGLACVSAAVDNDEHHEKTLNNNSDNSKNLSKSDLGYWSTKDCKLVSNGVGEMVAITGYLLEESGEMRDSGNEDGSDDMFDAAERIAAVSANLATTFSAFCK